MPQKPEHDLSSKDLNLLVDGEFQKASEMLKKVKKINEQAQAEAVNIEVKEAMVEDSFKEKVIKQELYGQPTKRARASSRPKHTTSKKVLIKRLAKLIDTTLRRYVPQNKYKATHIKVNAKKNKIVVRYNKKTHAIHNANYEQGFDDWLVTNLPKMVTSLYGR